MEGALCDQCRTYPATLVDFCGGATWCEHCQRHSIETAAQTHTIAPVLIDHDHLAMMDAASENFRRVQVDLCTRICQAFGVPRQRPGAVVPEPDAQAQGETWMRDVLVPLVEEAHGD